MKNILLVMFIMHFILAQYIIPQDGSNAGAFLRRGLDSRALALGGAYTSVSDDVSSIYWNPAGLNGIQHHSFNMMFSSLSLDRSEMFFGYGLTIKNVISIGIGVYKYGVTDIPYYGFGEINNGSFYEDAEYNFMVAAAKEFYYTRNIRFSIGVTTKYISHTLEDYSASTFSFDFGVLATINEMYRFGFVWQDMFAPNMTWNRMYKDSTSVDNVDDKVPSVIRIGGSVYPSLAFPFVVSLDLSFFDSKSDIKIGTGIRLIENFGVRAGVIFQNDGGDEKNILPTFGFFVWYQLDNIEMQFDYAGKQDRISGFAQYFTLAIRL